MLKERISEVLKTAKAKVANVPLGDSYEDIVKKVVANASYVVCRYQAGFEYEEAVRQDKRVVSIYWVLAGHSAHDGTSDVCVQVDTACNRVMITDCVVAFVLLQKLKRRSRKRSAVL